MRIVKEPPHPHTHTPQTLSVANNNFSSDLKALNISTLQIANQIISITSDFQINTLEINYFVSLVPAAHTNRRMLPTETHTSVLTTSHSVKVTVEIISGCTCWAYGAVQYKSSITERAYFNTHYEQTPPCCGENTTKTWSVDWKPSLLGGSWTKLAQPAWYGHNSTSSQCLWAESPDRFVKSCSWSCRGTWHQAYGFYSQTRESPTLHNESSEKTPISQVILGAVTDFAPPAENSPVDVINEISWRTIGSTESTEITEQLEQLSLNIPFQRRCIKRGPETQIKSILVQRTVLTETQEITAVTLAVSHHRPSVLVESSTTSQRRDWNSGGCWRRGHFIWTWSRYCADHCQDYRADSVRCWKKHTCTIK